MQSVCFSLQQGKKLAVAGATGSGKSTLLKIIAGLVQPDSGAVYFEGKRVLGPDEKLLPGHPAIGYLSQHFELRNNYTIGEELDYANLMPQEEAEAIYRLCDVAHLKHRGTNQVSGGEKQRIVTARLLTTRPRLLLLDEPYSNLDMGHRNAMKNIVRQIVTELGIACILVSHEPTDTLSWADEIIVLQNGKIVQQGSPTEVYHQPVNEYVASLFGQFNLLTPAQAKLLGVIEVEENRKLLVRPGYFSITTKENRGVAGIAQSVSFMGTHAELMISFPEGGEVTVLSLETQYHQGDQVFIELKNDAPQCWI